MLVEFRVRNFRSFRDEQTLSLVASNDTTLETNCSTKAELRLLKAAGVYGPNASGKSNLIKAIRVMQELVLNSAEFKPGSKLPITPFLLDDESGGRPSFFEVTFFHNDTRYQYGFTATSERIYEEWLLAYPKGQPQRWYERTPSKTDWKFGTFLKGEKKKLKDKTRDNALFLSVAAQWNNEQLTRIYEWFKDKLHIVPPRESFAPVTAEMLLDSGKEEWLYEFVTESLKDADFGISGVKVEKLDVNNVKFPMEMPRNAHEKFSELLEKNPPLKVEMLHRNSKTGKGVYLPLKDESDGTQRFFQLLGPWLETALFGYTVLIDELESSLHPLLTRELIKFIQRSEAKTGAPQLVFATHDTTLLDPELFRRDQIWFTEKDKDAGTQLYSMSDYKERKPRKGEAMQRGYLAGRYGAIPILQAFDIPNG